MAKKINRISLSGSLQGWDVKVWLARNLETFKILGAALGALASHFIVNLNEPWKALMSTAVFVAGKLALDTLHFLVKDVELEE